MVLVWILYFETILQSENRRKRQLRLRRMRDSSSDENGSCRMLPGWNARFRFQMPNHSAFRKRIDSRVTLSNSKNAVSFTSACTTKRFPLSPWASVIQIVRPFESRAEDPAYGTRYKPGVSVLLVHNPKPKPALISGRSIHRVLRQRLRRRGRWSQGQHYTSPAGPADLGENTVVDAGGGIGIASDDPAPFVDPIERSKRRARKIIDYKTMQRIEENAVRRARCVGIRRPTIALKSRLWCLLRRRTVLPNRIVLVEPTGSIGA